MTGTNDWRPGAVARNTLLFLPAADSMPIPVAEPLGGLDV
jgi:hypothetical protein